MINYSLLESACLLFSISILIFFSFKESRELKEKKEKKEIKVDKENKNG
jgi:hypothetical protein